MDFDFDKWAALYKADPAEFDRERTRVLTEAIAAAPKEIQQQLNEMMKRQTIIQATNRDDPMKSAGYAMHMLLQKTGEMQIAMENLAKTALEAAKQGGV